MCGRYSLAAPSPGQIRARFPVGESIEIRQRFNVAPTDDVLTVTTDKEGVPRGELLRWGLVPSWSKTASDGAKMINARAETVAEKPAYRRSFERFRCLVIADGFYEWRRVGDASPGGRKAAFHITQASGEPFAFAGLWSIWHGPHEEVIRSCTIITTAANDAIASLHDRMPVILDPGDEAIWLDHATPPSVLHEVLRGLDAEHTELAAVGPAVNNVRIDGPECLEPPEPDAQSALF